MDLLKKSISELSQLLDSCTITSEELTKKYIANIEKNQSLKKAYETLNKEGALSKAREIDRKRDQGEKLGLLAGIPMAIGDNISTKNILTTAGSKVLGNYTPPYDASVVDSLLDQGGVILGKINIKEFSLKPSYSDSTILLEGGAAYVISTHTGGKGLVSLKATYGSVSRYGLIGGGSSFEQIGVSARCLEDAAIVLNTIIGYDRKDSTSVKVEKKDYRDIHKGELEDFKVLVPKEFLNDEEKSKFSLVLEQLRERGFSVEGLDLETIKYLIPAYKVLFSAEFASNVARYDGIKYGYRTKEYEDREDLYRKTRTEAFGQEAKLAILFGNLVINADNYGDLYEKAQKVRAMIKKEVEGILHDKSIIMTPIEGSLNGEIREAYGLLVSMAGLPALSTYYRLINYESIGLQLIGGAFKEKDLLQFANVLN